MVIWQLVMGIVMKVNMIVISTCVGIGMGARPIIGFNRGAGEPADSKGIFAGGQSAASAVTVTGWLCCQFIPEEILLIFGSNGEDFMAFAVSCMPIILRWCLCSGFPDNIDKLFSGNWATA